jgi:hypothetical protein
MPGSTDLLPHNPERIGQMRMEIIEDGVGSTLDLLRRRGLSATSTPEEIAAVAGGRTDVEAALTAMVAEVLAHQQLVEAEE